MAMMMLSSTGAVLASCAEEEAETPTTEEETEEEEETVSDDYIVTNAGFETFDDNDGENLIVTSVNGWSRSTNSTASGSAKSSTAASGIVDTADAAWKNLTTSGLTDLKARELTEEQAAANWENMTAKDKLEYYEAWEDNDDNDGDIEDLEFYQSFNIDEDDLPLYRTKDEDDNETAVAIANPGTHYTNADNDKTKVLMIHNEYSTTSYEKFGTAQKFTSSSTVTVAAGTSAKLSLWVKTSNLEMTDTDGNVQDAVGKGAYIRITNTLGGQSLDPVEVKNIDTESMDSASLSNGWAQYEFILKGSSYADATFTIVLGLGQSGGDDRHEYVNGYAFFDDITCETVETTDTLLDGYSEVDLSTPADQKIVNATNVTAKKFALDLSDGVEMSDISAAIDASDITFGDTREEITSSVAVDYWTSVSKQIDGTALPEGVKTWGGLGFDPTNDKAQVFTNAAAMDGSQNAYLQTAYDHYFKDTEFLKDNQILMLLSASGASYTAKFAAETLPAESYRIVSFFVKTSNMSGFTGAGVTVKDGNGETVSSLTAIDTSAIEGVTIGENENVYDGWQQCFIFLSNETEDAQSYTIELTFGPTTISDTTKASYQTGFAAFAGLQYNDTINEEQFAYAQSGTYAIVAELDASEEEATGNGGFDSVSTGSSRKIEDGFADLKNYKGVTADSAYIAKTKNYDINTLATAGLLSKEELYDNVAYATILDALGAGSLTTNEEKWEVLFGNNALAGYTANQPLVIYNPSQEYLNATEGRENEVAAPLAYGFIGATTNITDYTVISYNVKVSGGAVANFYLVDTDSENKSVMSIAGKRAYWYDTNGNICTADPTKSSFNTKKDVAFKLQANGLYKLNASWKNAESVTNKDAYYANLTAYDKDSDGNLIVADGGVSYDYNSKWRNDGNDGIAFYYKDGKYYADSAKTIEVLSLDTVISAEDERANEAAAKNLQITVSDTGGDWATVTFYVHPGDSGKNYRLEIWSGSRDGTTKSPAGSHVIVDTRTPNALTADTFATYTENRKDELDKANKSDQYFESVFSFYDSAKFLRYNAELDENAVGNSYDDFDPTSTDYVKGIAYLRYESGNVYEVYADYATTDKTVTADVDEEEEAEEEETEEETTWDGNVWLLVSSISMAAVLLLVIILIIFRKAIGGKKRRNRAAKTAKVKKEKPAKKAKKVEGEKDEDSPYND